MIINKIKSIPLNALLNSSFLKNSIYAVLGSLISKGLNFLTIAFIARIVGPKIFGEYNVIQTTIGLFGTVSGLGFGLAATKLIAEWKGRNNEMVGEMIGTLYSISFIISVLVAATFFIMSSWISSELLGNSALSILLKITACIVIFDSINGIQLGVLSGFEEFKEITRISFITGIISAPILVLGANYWGLTGLTFALLLTRFINVFITRYFIIHKIIKIGIKIRNGITKKRLRAIFKISMPSFLTNMAVSPVNWVATSIFVNQPFGYVDLGTFNAANQLRQLVLFLPDSAGKVSIPKLANAYGNGNQKVFKKTIITTLVWNFLLSLIPALFLFLTSFLFEKFIGLEYNLSKALIITILLTGVMIAITNAVGYIFICSNLIWYDLGLRIIWGISLILILMFYGKYEGAIGFGISTLGAYLLYFVLQIIFLGYKFLLKIKPNNSKSYS